MFKPGAPGLMGAGRALADPSRRRGDPWSYQWLVPGPNSRAVRAAGQAQMPAAYGTSVDLATYQVPEGMRFSVRGVVAGAVAESWVEGSGDLLFTLAVTGGGAPRNVDYFVNVATRLGSSVIPWPVDGRLEFQSLDILTWSMVPVQNVVLGGQNFGYAMILGHEYPNTEAGDD